MTYYKVTTSDNASVCVSQRCRNSKFCVRYKEGKWVRPRVKGTKVFCFKTAAEAKHFAECQAEMGYRIWEVEVKNPTDEYEYFFNCVYDPDFPERVEALLKGEAVFHPITGVEEEFTQDWSMGTVFCDAVKLTKLVEEVI